MHRANNKTTCITFNVVTDYNEELRLVTAGMTGVGKSSLLNSICGADFVQSKDEDGVSKFSRPFKSKTSSQSVTKECRMHTAEILGRRIKVVDTPGFFDTKTPFWDTIREVSRCCLLVEPGPHAIILVIKIGRFTDEVVRAIGTMKMVFGDNCVNFLCIVFTGADDLMRDDSSIEEYIGDLDDKYKALINIECKLRYLAFNNTYKPGSEENKEQVSKFLQLIDRTICDNEGKYYTNYMLEEASKIMYEEKERKEREEKEHQNRLRALEEREQQLQNEIENLRKEREEAREREMKLKEETEKQINTMKTKIIDLENEQERNRQQIEDQKRMRESQAEAFNELKEQQMRQAEQARQAAINAQRAATANEERHRKELADVYQKIAQEKENANKEKQIKSNFEKQVEQLNEQLQKKRKTKWFEYILPVAGFAAAKTGCIVM